VAGCCEYGDEPAGSGATELNMPSSCELIFIRVPSIGRSNSCVTVLVRKLTWMTPTVSQMTVIIILPMKD
jgi:hypothetical protein